MNKNKKPENHSQFMHRLQDYYYQDFPQIISYLQLTRIKFIAVILIIFTNFQIISLLFNSEIQTLFN